MAFRPLALLVLAGIVLAGGAWYVFSPGGLAFPGIAAYTHVRAIVNCGERQPESEGSRLARQVILKALQEGGVQAEEKSYEMSVPMPDPATGQPRRAKFTNVVARVKGQSEATIAWGTHYDTPVVKGETIVGANDGGSGVGVLIELAKLVQDGTKPKLTHVFLFLDGEEKIGDLPWNHKIGEQTANACFGSRAQAQEWSKDNRLPRAFILLDMVGDTDLGILWESKYSSVKLKNIFERVARDAGVGQHFFKRTSQVEDDHGPFADCGVPVIDLIDLNYGPPHPERSGGAYWHSSQDTLENISPDSLEIVGRVCRDAIPRLEKEFLQ